MTDYELARIIFKHSGIPQSDWLAHFRQDTHNGRNELRADVRRIYRQIFYSLR